jgi:hypothetical protein
LGHGTRGRKQLTEDQNPYWTRTAFDVPLFLKKTKPGKSFSRSQIRFIFKKTSTDYSTARCRHASIAGRAQTALNQWNTRLKATTERNCDSNCNIPFNFSARQRKCFRDVGTTTSLCQLDKSWKVCDANGARHAVPIRPNYHQYYETSANFYVKTRVALALSMDMCKLVYSELRCGCSTWWISSFQSKLWRCFHVASPLCLYILVLQSFFKDNAAAYLDN